MDHRALKLLQLSVKVLYPQVKRQAEIQKYFPDYPEGKLPDREYFFRVLSNKCCDWLESQIKNADRVRHEEIDPTKVLNTIEFTEKRLKEMEESGAVGSKLNAATSV